MQIEAQWRERWFDTQVEDFFSTHLQTFFIWGDFFGGYQLQWTEGARLAPAPLTLLQQHALTCVRYTHTYHVTFCTHARTHPCLFSSPHQTHTQAIKAVLVRSASSELLQGCSNYILSARASMGNDWDNSHRCCRRRSRQCHRQHH